MIFRFLITMMLIISGLLLFIEDVSANDGKEISINGETMDVHFTKLSGDGYQYEVILEDGQTYFYEENEEKNLIIDSGTLTDEESRMAREAIYKYENQYREPAEGNGDSGNPAGIFFVAIGAFLLISPRTAWYLEIGWKLRDAEPSELVLIANRVGGGIAAVIGILALL
ncbi:DUF6199 family natural product biosynthesis protein [Salimicrobium flavidum]|uniref:DUF6199 domain-containing protein n=1 Tax=Salimicrobium flavidum TaxID=570947 RepID=A0A1N7J862_9BACI|nr:DUF6199 family natural product biosynthesis protein [Salimicrobium flavidum]SIS45553.1 hypothetical protein SAMN05421687_104127 [Salimicrobium flavidum]